MLPLTFLSPEVTLVRLEENGHTPAGPEGRRRPLGPGIDQVPMPEWEDSSLGETKVPSGVSNLTGNFGAGPLAVSQPGREQAYSEGCFLFGSAACG